MFYICLITLIVAKKEVLLDRIIATKPAENAELDSKRPSLLHRCCHLTRLSFLPRESNVGKGQANEVVFQLDPRFGGGEDDTHPPLFGQFLAQNVERLRVIDVRMILLLDLYGIKDSVFLDDQVYFDLGGSFNPVLLLGLVLPVIKEMALIVFFAFVDVAFDNFANDEGLKESAVFGSFLKLVRG